MAMAIYGKTMFCDSIDNNLTLTLYISLNDIMEKQMKMEAQYLNEVFTLNFLISKWNF